MAHQSSSFDLAQRTRGFAVRVGHDVVWLVIAGLFCLVEAAVHLTTPFGSKRARTQRG